MAIFQLKNVRGADKRKSHERSNTGSATANGCRPKKTAPASSESRTGGYAEIGSGSFGSHRPTVAHSGEDRKQTDRRQVPWEAFLSACASHDIVGQMRPSGVRRKCSPLRCPPRSLQNLL